MVRPYTTPGKKTARRYTVEERVERFRHFERPVLMNADQCITEMMTLWKQIPYAERALPGYVATTTLIDQLPLSWRDYVRYQLSTMIVEVPPDYKREVSFRDFVLRLMTHWIVIDALPIQPIWIPVDDPQHTLPRFTPLVSSPRDPRPVRDFPSPLPQHRGKSHIVDLDPTSQLAGTHPKRSRSHDYEAGPSRPRANLDHYSPITSDPYYPPGFEPILTQPAPPSFSPTDLIPHSSLEPSSTLAAVLGQTPTTSEDEVLRLAMDEDGDGTIYEVTRWEPIESSEPEDHVDDDDEIESQRE